MPEYTARWGAMNNTADNFKGYATTIDRCQNSIRNLSRNLYLDSGAARSVQQRLDMLSNTLENLQKKCGYMGTTLSNAAQNYQKTENEILSNTVLSTDIENATSKNNVSPSSQISKESEMAKYVRKLIEGIGIPGKVIGTLWNLVNSGNKEYSWYDRLNSGVGALKDILKLISGANSIVKATGASAKWKVFWGLNNFVETTVEKGANFSQRLKAAKKAFTESIDDTFPNAAKGKMKFFTKWGGHCLTAVSNIIDNVKEYNEGGITIERAVNETIMETAIDIGKDALIGAGITAACVAAVGSAPAVVVAAGTVAAGWAVDKVTKWATKKFTGKERDFTEFASDTILDFKEKVTSVKSSVAKWFMKPLLSGAW